MTSNYLSEEQVQRLLAPINPRRVAQLEGLSHLEAYDVRAHLTRIFGFGRWGEHIIDKRLLYAQPTQTRNGKEAVKVAYDVTVRLTIKAPDGTLLTELDGAAVGESIMPTFKEGDAYDMALKTACSQALKRCAIDLGDQFGLSLYRNGSHDAIVLRTLVGAEIPEDGKAPDEHAPEVVPEAKPEVGEESQEVPETGPTDGETVHQGPREGKVRRIADWVKAIEDCADLDCTKQLWREASNAAMLDVDVDGTDIRDRLLAKAEQLKERAKRPSERQAGPVREAAQRLEQVVASKAVEDERKFQNGPGGDGAVPGPPAADADVKPGRARNASLTALTEVYGGDESVRDAAVEQLAGKPIGLVGNRALSRILGEQTAGAPA